jgi:large subunit ribosomal protein L1
MAKKGKKYTAAAKKVEATKVYAATEACDLVCDTKTAKFDESVEVAIRLGVDPKKADQAIRGSAALPHGLGKQVRIAVFAKGEKAIEAQQAGADVVGSDDLVERVKNGDLDFDAVVATPDMMVQVGKVGKVLGPRGLMPSPKIGTVTFDVTNVIQSIKAGRAEFKVDKSANLHAIVGKASFGGQKIKENLEALFVALNRAKPSSSKGVYLESATLSLTMGPGVKLDVSEFRG